MEANPGDEDPQSLMHGPSMIHSTEVRLEAYCSVIVYGCGHLPALVNVRTQVDSPYGAHAAVH